MRSIPNLPAREARTRHLKKSKRFFHQTEKQRYNFTLFELVIPSPAGATCYPMLRITLYCSVMIVDTKVTTYKNYINIL